MSYQDKLNEIVDFLLQYRLIIDSHVTAVYIVDYFSSIPDPWFSDLSSFSYTTLLQIQSNIPLISDASLKNFFMKCQELSPNYPEYLSSFELTRVEIYGMNPKKIHESSRLASYIKSKSYQFNINKSIDIGSGQGYLSHLLVTKGNMKVTAIEAKEHNSHESEKRGKIISEKLGIQGEFETVSMLVTHDNIGQFTQEPCFLVGLHTCGNLSPICMKLFLDDPNIKGIINVGCCYQHLTEYISPLARENVQDYIERVSQSFSGRSIDETLCYDESIAGFPLSNYMKANFPTFFLGRLSRTLAISEPQPLHSKNAQLTFKKFQYRAAFQSFLQRNFPEFSLTFVIGNRLKRFDTFAHYAIDAFKKMSIPHTYSEEFLDEFYNENFLGLEKKSASFWVIRSALSGVIENLMILDRAVFLQERGMITEITTIFDKLISPRNVIVAGFKPE